MGHRTRSGLTFHCDASDTVGLLCLRSALRGGLSSLASSTTVINEAVARRPDLAELWFEPWCFDLRDEQAPGTAPYYSAPLARWDDGRLSIRLVPSSMDLAHRHPDVPPRTEARQVLLDLVQDILEEPGVVLHMDIRPGDIQLVNNHTVLHSRTAYEDGPLPSQRRHLLRIWLAIPAWHGFAPAFEDGPDAARFGKLGVAARADQADPDAGTRI